MAHPMASLGNERDGRLQVYFSGNRIDVIAPDTDDDGIASNLPLTEAARLLRFLRAHVGDRPEADIEILTTIERLAAVVGSLEDCTLETVGQSIDECARLVRSLRSLYDRLRAEVWA